MEVLESLRILFASNTSKENEFRDVILQKYGNWTLNELYNYYVEEEQDNNTYLVVKNDRFEF